MKDGYICGSTVLRALPIGFIQSFADLHACFRGETACIPQNFHSADVPNSEIPH